jgi:hypothetical protein
MSSTTVEPYRVQIAQQQLDDLAERRTRTRWPDEVPGTGWDRGVPLAYLEQRAQYWHDGYDWRRAEGELNACPQFRTVIDGQRVHFIRVRATQSGAVPLLPCLPGHGFSGHTIVRWTEFDRRGHFPALEAPDLFVADLHDFPTNHHNRQQEQPVDNAAPL